MPHEDRFTHSPRRTTLWIGSQIIIIAAVLSILGGAAFGLISMASQPSRVIQKTFDADNMISNYEWFRQQYADILAMDAKISASVGARISFEESAGDRSTWKSSDRQQWDQLNRIVLGLENQRTTMVASYNARATMTNRSIFINPPVVGGPTLPDRL